MVILVDIPGVGPNKLMPLAYGGAGIGIVKLVKTKFNLDTKYLAKVISKYLKKIVELFSKVSKWWEITEFDGFE